MFKIEWISQSDGLLKSYDGVLNLCINIDGHWCMDNVCLIRNIVDLFPWNIADSDIMRAPVHKGRPRANGRGVYWQKTNGRMGCDMGWIVMRWWIKWNSDVQFFFEIFRGFEKGITTLHLVIAAGIRISVLLTPTQQFPLGQSRT